MIRNTPKCIRNVNVNDSPEKDHVQKVKRSRQPNDKNDEDAFGQLPFTKISDRPEDLFFDVVDGFELELVRLFADLAHVDAHLLPV